jgi:hypothetical protein
MVWYLCQGPTNARGLYDLYPRAAYYVLREAHNVNPFAEGASLEYVDNAFSNISLIDAVLRAASCFRRRW